MSRSFLIFKTITDCHLCFLIASAIQKCVTQGSILVTEAVPVQDLETSVAHMSGERWIILKWSHLCLATSRQGKKRNQRVQDHHLCPSWTTVSHWLPPRLPPGGASTPPRPAERDPPLSDGNLATCYLLYNSCDHLLLLDDPGQLDNWCSLGQDHT